MSTSATVALVGIAATGVFKIWRALEPAVSVRQFIDSSYGEALAVKLLLVAIAIALGGINRFRVLPRLFDRMASAGTAERWGRALVAILRFEALTLALVLVAAAVLSGIEPPSES
jgi:putative copper resistance protein D